VSVGRGENGRDVVSDSIAIAEKNKHTECYIHCQQWVEHSKLGQSWEQSFEIDRHDRTEKTDR
jgi:hypothetical protein